MQDRIYFNARKTAGLTQERWAEVLGISVESVRAYETGASTPGDEIVLRMAEVAGQQIICYWHLLQKSRAAAAVLPPVERKPLSEAVCQLLHRLGEFSDNHRDDELLWIAANGRVDPGEQARVFGEIEDELDRIVQAAMQVKYAESAS